MEINKEKYEDKINDKKEIKRTEKIEDKKEDKKSGSYVDKAKEHGKMDVSLTDSKKRTASLCPFLFTFIGLISMCRSGNCRGIGDGHRIIARCFARRCSLR